jgi:hypothetical protein
MSVKYLIEIVFFNNGQTRWEIIDKFSLEGNSPQSSYFESD